MELANIDKIIPLIKERVAEINLINKQIFKIKNEDLINNVINKWLLDHNKVLTYESDEFLPSFYGSHNDARELFEHMIDQGLHARADWAGYGKPYSFHIDEWKVAQMIVIPRDGHLMKSPVRASSGLLRESDLQFKIRLLESFCNPRESIDDWKEQLEKDVAIQLTSPIVHPIYYKNPLSEKIQEAIMEKFIKGNREVILVGGNAYNILMKESGYKHPDMITYKGTVVEFLTKNTEEHIQKLREITQEMAGELDFSRKIYNNIVTNKVYSRTAVFRGATRIAEVYGIEDRCTPFVEYKVDGQIVQVGSVHMVQLYLAIGCWIGSKINDERLMKGLINMLAFLEKGLEHYLDGKGLSGVEDSAGLFRIFQYRCLGSHVTEFRYGKLGEWQGDKRFRAKHWHAPRGEQPRERGNASDSARSDGEEAKEDTFCPS